MNLSTTKTFQTDPLPAESTATVTMRGVYDGSQGTGPLKFKVGTGGIHGTNSLSLEVYSPEDSLIDTFDVLSTDPLNQSCTLSNGLSFQVSSGSLKAGQSSFLDDIRQQLKTAVTESFKSSQSNGAFHFGLQFDFSGSGKEVIGFESMEQKQLMSALQSASGRAALRKLLFAGESQFDGLAERLTTITKSAERTVSLELGSGAYRNPYRR